ncbi:RDD family protein [Haloactinopolyspora alba]|uniref:RDD family protein n=1 Tax=Haloactinopolyspora alba TaxID=648780 RepID=A0A2P8DRB1_9ACTN|nr:RDD family protein [Haloactinopolyspora alba]PSK99750.1 RDD family protein [Haloactinopolyspora alba]
MSNDEHSATAPRLPTAGPGSPASWPRRFAALAVDWILANILAAVVVGGAAWDPQSTAVWAPLICWYLIVVASTATMAASMGQVLLRIRVVHLDGHRVSPITAAVRTALIALVIPPLVFTSQGRGLHDLASNTAVVNV